MIKVKHSACCDAEYDDGLLAVRVRGEIDHHSAVALRAGIDEQIYEKRPQKLILDLSEVDFMDSSGLGLILGRYSAIKDIGGEMVLLNPNPTVTKILKLAGAERILKIEYVDLGNDKNVNKKEGRRK